MRVAMMGRMAIVALLVGVQAEPVIAQTPAVGYDTVLRLVARDAFTLLQVELGTGRFTLDQTATEKGMNGMTSVESVIISVPAGASAAEWDVAVRKQLAAKVVSLAAKVSFATKIGIPPIPTTDGTVIVDVARGIALGAKSSLERGVTGNMTITLLMLVGR